MAEDIGGLQNRLSEIFSKATRILAGRRLLFIEHAALPRVRVPHSIMKRFSYLLVFGSH